MVRYWQNSCEVQQHRSVLHLEKQNLSSYLSSAKQYSITQIGTVIYAEESRAIVAVSKGATHIAITNWELTKTRTEDDGSANIASYWRATELSATIYLLSVQSRIESRLCSSTLEMKNKARSFFLSFFPSLTLSFILTKCNRIDYKNLRTIETIWPAAKFLYPLPTDCGYPNDFVMLIIASVIVLMINFTGTVHRMEKWILKVLRIWDFRNKIAELLIIRANQFASPLGMKYATMSV